MWSCFCSSLVGWGLWCQWFCTKSELWAAGSCRECSSPDPELWRGCHSESWHINAENDPRYGKSQWSQDCEECQWFGARYFPCYWFLWYECTFRHIDKSSLTCARVCSTFVFFVTINDAWNFLQNSARSIHGCMRNGAAYSGKSSVSFVPMNNLMITCLAAIACKYGCHADLHECQKCRMSHLVELTLQWECPVWGGQCCPSEFSQRGSQISAWPLDSPETAVVGLSQHAHRQNQQVMLVNQACNISVH